MRNVDIKESKIISSTGKIFIKKWTPESCLRQVPIVLLHDSLGSADLWRDFPAVLARKTFRSVIAYDRLGFGKSDARQELPQLEFIREEATDFFPVVKKQLAIKKYILFGHSVGGAMSINIAARDQDCTGVVTVAAQAFVENRTVQGIKEALKKFDQPGQVERLEKWHGEKARWVLRAWADLWLSPELSAWSLEDCIRDVRCPVLVIHGDRDEYGSTAFPEYIADRVGGVSDMRILENCGHMPHFEKAEEVVGAVKQFFDINHL